MKKTQPAQEIVTESKKYFSEAIKTIYFNNLTFQQWKSYFNILKAAIALNVSTQNILMFAEALDFANVIKVFAEEADAVNYAKMKEEIKTIIKNLREPQMPLENNKIMLLTPNMNRWFSFS